MPRGAFHASWALSHSAISRLIVRTGPWSRQPARSLMEPIFGENRPHASGCRNNRGAGGGGTGHGGVGGASTGLVDALFHGDVGALQLLRDAGLSHPLHG